MAFQCFEDKDVAGYIYGRVFWDCMAINWLITVKGYADENFIRQFCLMHFRRLWILPLLPLWTFTYLLGHNDISKSHLLWSHNRGRNNLPLIARIHLFWCCSWIKWCSTHKEHTRLICNVWVSIWWTLPTLTSRILESCWIVRERSSWIVANNVSTFTLLVALFEHSGRAFGFELSCPSQSWQYQEKTFDYNKTSSSYASFMRSYVLEALFCGCTQKWFAELCSSHNIVLLSDGIFLSFLQTTQKPTI